MNLLDIRSIGKTYGTGETAVHALKNITFSVPKGEFVAVVGESGSGKSTLLNMIALVAVINIVNTVNASVSGRINHYGVMRAIGMSGKQLKKWCGQKLQLTQLWATSQAVYWG